MIYRDNDRIVVEGAVTVRNVVDLMQQGVALLDSSRLYIDLHKVTEVDSTAISMLFEWLRVAEQRNCHLEFVHFPQSLESLMQLYGVTPLLQSVQHR